MIAAEASAFDGWLASFTPLTPTPSRRTLKPDTTDERTRPSVKPLSDAKEFC